MPNPKRKGNIGENRLAAFLTSNGIRCFRNASSGGGINKSDLHNEIGYNIEVKTVARLNLQEAWKQSARDAGMAHSTPSLFVHFDGMAENDWLVVIGVDEWLRIILGESEGVTPQVDEQFVRNLQYKLENLKRATRDFVKAAEGE